MDKENIMTFIFSIYAFIGLGVGITSLIIFFIKGISGIFELGISITMIMIGLFGVFYLFSNKP